LIEKNQNQKITRPFFIQENKTPSLEKIIETKNQKSSQESFSKSQINEDYSKAITTQIWISFSKESEFFFLYNYNNVLLVQRKMKMNPQNIKVLMIDQMKRKKILKIL